MYYKMNASAIYDDLLLFVYPCANIILFFIYKMSTMLCCKYIRCVHSGVMIAASVTKEDLPCVGRTVFKVGEGRMCSTGEFTGNWATCEV